MTRRILPIALTAVLVIPVPALACPVCFQNVDSALLDGARLGVLAMAGVTVCMLAIFARWFVKLRALAAAVEATGDAERRHTVDPSEGIGVPARTGAEAGRRHDTGIAGTQA